MKLIKITKSSYWILYIATVAFFIILTILSHVLQTSNEQHLSKEDKNETPEVENMFSSIPDVEELHEIELCSEAQSNSYQSEAAYFYNGSFYIYKTPLNEKIDDSPNCLDLIYSLSEEVTEAIEESQCYDSYEAWSCRNELLDGMSNEPYLYKVLLRKLYIVDVENKSLFSNEITFDPAVNDLSLFEISDDGPHGSKIYKQGKRVVGLSYSKRYLLYRIGGDAYPTYLRSKEDCNGETKCTKALQDYEDYVRENGGNGLFIIDLDSNEAKKIEDIAFDSYDPIEVKWLEECDVFEFYNLKDQTRALYDVVKNEKVELGNSL